jgi:putrescine aminotransferase
VSAGDFDAYGRYVNPAQACFLAMVGRGWRFVRGEGCALFTEDGDRFDDWLAGFGALPLGHDPPSLRAALSEAIASGAPNLYSEALNPAAGSLAEKLLRATGWPQGNVHFCNSGAEAVETLLKTAIAATGRSVIVYVSGGYHGCTLGALACMAEGLYRAPFEGAMPRFVEVAWGDVSALEAAFAAHAGQVAGVLAEVVQVESGVRMLPRAWLEAARRCCDREGALLLFDEVQSGLGRTGFLWSFEREGIEPDAFAVAKGLGGGWVAIGAAVLREGVWARAFGRYDRAEIHASTMGGNRLACAVGEAVVSIVSDEAFLRSVRERGDRLWAALREALSSRECVENVCGYGLLGAVRLRESEHPWLTWEGMGMPDFTGKPTAGPIAIDRLGRKRVLAQVCGHDWSSVRVEPPLTVDDAACERFVTAMSAATGFLDGVR